MIILAIETSCDDTCVAILKAKRGKKPSFAHPNFAKQNLGGFKILSNIVSSQVKIHRKWGGVYPALAKREHQKNLPVIFKKALRQAQGKLLRKTQSKPIDLIAVTVGPGLEPCLWVGVNFVKELAEKLNLPIIQINHIEAHIYANFIGVNSKFEIRNSKFIFPAVCLVVSGGHTQLILMKDFGKYKILGETRDDAAGECFDKVARILGLGYPGGPIVAAQAAKLKTSARGGSAFGGNNYKLITKLPRPMIYQKNYDFSFSGLKTAVLYYVRSMKYEEIKKRKFIQEMCHEVQQAIIDVLLHKTLKAAKGYKAQSIILGGGVVANDGLRKQFKKTCSASGFKLLVPPKNLCTDNAAMIAVAAYYRWQRGKTQDWSDIKADANLRIG